MSSFAWEEAYKRTWEKDHVKLEEIKRIRQEKIINTKRKGIIRHFHIIIDSSERIDESGYIPNYRSNIITALNNFIPSFYEENPISVLSISIVRNQKTEITIKTHLDFNTKDILNIVGSGYFSLSCLEDSLSYLESSNYVKEILIITQSLSIRNNENINETVNKLKMANIKVHCINLCAEVEILKILCRSTNGFHYVPLDRNQFDLILMEFCIPKMINSIQKISLMKFGFPETLDELSICSCHLEMTKKGFICPVCETKICSLPMECPICKTQLISFVNISKALYHQYQLNSFELDNTKICRVCDRKSTTKCKDCNSYYCSICDDFIHDKINFCIFCDSKE